MKQHHSQLLADIRAFLSRTGMGPAYFGVRAANNSLLVKRLEAGKRIWPDTEQRVRSFMESYETPRHRAHTSEALGGGA